MRPVVVMHTRMGTTRSDVGRIVCFRSGRSEQEQYILPPVTRHRDPVVLFAVPRRGTRCLVPNRCGSALFHTTTVDPSPQSYREQKSLQSSVVGTAELKKGVQRVVKSLGGELARVPGEADAPGDGRCASESGWERCGTGHAGRRDTFLTRTPTPSEWRIGPSSRTVTAWWL